MSKWETVSLGDLVKIKGGKRLPKGSFLQTVPNAHPYIRVRDMGQRYLPSEGLEYVPDDVFPAIKNYIVNTNDVIMSIVGSIGLISVVDDKFENASLTENCVKLSGLDHDDALYLYYYLSSEVGQYEIHKGTIGAVQAKLPLYNIAKLSISWPEKNQRKAIASILSNFDDKIALNREMNKTLEAMAQAIFKSWFVDFEPFRDGEFVESELGMIPKGWEVKPLTEDFVITMGQSPDGKTYNENGEGIPFFQGRTDFGFRFPSNRIYCTDPKRYAKKFDTLVSVRAPVGDMNLAIEDCCIGRGLSAVRHKKGYYSFTYYLLKSIDEKFKQFEHNGTVFGSINKASFENLKAIIPNDVLICDFEKIVNAIDDQIYSLSNEIQTLSILRDTLLPKLLSGEIEV